MRNLSLLTELLQSLRLHFVTQATSADPAHTFEDCCFCTLLRLSVPEPERPFSLASTFITSGSCRAYRLACSLSGRLQATSLSRCCLQTSSESSLNQLRPPKLLYEIEHHHPQDGEYKGYKFRTTVPVGRIDYYQYLCSR